MNANLPKTVTLSNDFHHSSSTVRVPGDGVLSIGQTKKILRELCGIEGCTCGGIRGPQDGIPDGFCIDTYSHQDRYAILAQDAVTEWQLRDA